MNDRPAAERDAKVLSEPLATRVLTRASELDAALRAGASIAELRQAALEAGISAQAFEAALAEVQDAGSQVPAVNTRPRSGGRKWILAAAIVLLAAYATVRRSQSPAPIGTAASVVEEAFLLRCLSPGQAAALIRPLLRSPDGGLVYSSDRAPRVLTVRATPAQLQEVRSLLDRYDGAGSSACAATPPPATR